MLIPFPRPPTPAPSDLSSITLREACPPSQGELAKFYPAKYTWEQLKSFMQSGDLALLKRHPELQKQYNAWAGKIRAEHGSISNYLVNVRLGWGPRPADATGTPSTANASPSASVSSLTPPLEFTSKPEYFVSTPSPDDVKIIFNDWPYSIPPEILHYVVWSRLPVVHPALVHPSVKAQIERDGLWGFGGIPEEENPTGQEKVYTDVAPGTSPIDRARILAAAHHTHQFVLAHWPEDEWEVAWFVNPPRIQSVKDISHIHVFARHK